MNRINLICLGVEDLAKSLKFYKGIGFKTLEKDSNPPIVFFNNQGSKLELFNIHELAKDIDAKNPPKILKGGFSGITLACNMKSEQEVDDMMRIIEQHGGVVVKQPQKVFWGGYSGYFQDPDGYYWEVAYGPNWKFDENDMLVLE
ncbi:Glyoxalase [Elusimicrobium minutum Pei191]|uniref:Glyoxalase n=1 Tax=Elusimicrobium minutum (strain Pei191) TaxID=445932 RepID=B2KDL9_ELUMP|nr:VOC family protein [Elusimicrobium minutum]ACC98615.1 Glyoxalase [Elusimicrobium minutum Pei191]